jgi:Tol biopolymer transport system component
MDADGSHVRGLVDSRQKEAIDGHVYNLAWSPDGSRLAFDTDDGIWVVGFDGSGLRMVIRHGANPNWCPMLAPRIRHLGRPRMGTAPDCRCRRKPRSDVRPRPLAP